MHTYFNHLTALIMVIRESSLKHFLQQISVHAVHKTVGNTKD